MDRTLKDSIDNPSTQPHGSSQGSSNRLSRAKQLQLELKYKQMNEDLRLLKEAGINSKEVIEKSKFMKKKLKQANDLSRTAFETGSQNCIQYDAEYFFNGAEVNHMVVKSLQVDSQAFDQLYFAEKLRTYIAPDTRIRDESLDENDLEIDDFIQLHKKCGYLLNSVPILSYMYGAFEPGEIVIPTKKRRVGVRENYEPKEDVKKPNSKQGVDETDDLKNVKEVERVLNDLKFRYDKEKKPINFFKALANPKSFCETVENIFYSAFLVKEGVVSVKEKKSSTDKPTVVLEPQEIDSEDEGRPRGEERGNSQSILSFCQEDWKSWHA